MFSQQFRSHSDDLTQMHAGKPQLSSDVDRCDIKQTGLELHVMNTTGPTQFEHLHLGIRKGQEFQHQVIMVACAPVLLQQRSMHKHGVSPVLIAAHDEPVCQGKAHH